MEKSHHSLKILNDLMRVIHPELHEAGSATLEKLKDLPSVKDAAVKWTSIFSGISLIANRKTKEHRDRNSAINWYDLLVTLGNYEEAFFDIPEFGLRLRYTPGTVVAICGNSLLHGVKEWGSGDRLCYAMFMRKYILDRFGLGAGWMTQERYSCSGTQKN
jgi:hypothetical protein